MHKSFALIYTLLFIVLLLITVSVTWFTGMADIRLARRTEYSTAAMQLAKSAIDEGWVKYQDAIGATFPLPVKNIPPIPPDTTNYTNVCNTSGGAAYHRVDLSQNPFVESNIATLTSSSLPNLTQTIVGVYDYRVCSSNSSNIYIEGIGYYKGNKITLKAIVGHGSNEGYCDPAVGTFPTCTDGTTTGTPKLDHSNDSLTIYQTGPSK